MTKRRQLLSLLSAAALAPAGTFAQSKQAPPLIGWLDLASRAAGARSVAAFREGLAALGWKSSQFAIEERWADGRYEQLQQMAEELISKKPAIIVASPLTSVTAVAKAAPSTPVVIGSGGDPVAAGIVASLARPGGMITGLTSVRASFSEKFLELLLAAVPKIQRVGFLADPKGASYQGEIDAARRSVAQYRVDARFVDATSPEGIDTAASSLAKEGAQALIVLSGGVLGIERRRIAKLGLAHRWPVVAGAGEFADEGVLLTYGPDRLASYRRAAYYVDRILKGARPGELPIEQPTKFELVINLKTAKALGLTLPQPFLMRADRVIE